MNRCFTMNKYAIFFLVSEVCFKSIRNTIPAPTAAASMLAQVLSENEIIEGFSSFKHLMYDS